MTESTLTDEQIKRLLRRIESEHGVPPGSRARHRAEVLADFDDLRDDGDEQAVISLVRPVRTDQPTRLRGRRLAPLVAVAAAVSLILGLAILVPFGRGANAPADSVPTPIPTLPGVTTPSLLDGSFTFDTPDGFVSTERQDGSIWLAPGGDKPSLEGSVVLVPVEGAAIADGIMALDRKGAVRSLRSTYRVGNVVLPRWELSVQQRAARDLSCVAGEPCLEVVSGLDGSAISQNVKWIGLEVPAAPDASVLVLASDVGDLTDAAEHVVASAVSDTADD